MTTELLISDFAECAACAAKAGAPTLCTACLHNRKLVGDLKQAVRKHSQMLDEHSQMLEKAVQINKDLITSQETAKITVADVITAAVGRLQASPSVASIEAIAGILAALAKEIRLRAEDRLGEPRLS
jgi:hypothetical protein